MTGITELDFAQGENLPVFPLEFAKLTSILEKTLNDLYSLRSSQVLSIDFRLTFETARPLLNSLTKWAECAPTLDTRDTLGGPENVASLYMAYHAIKILIFRALLRPFNQETCQISPDNKAEWQAAKAHIRQAALLEIDAALDLVSSLKARDHQAFWAPWHKTSFALVTHLGFLLAVLSSKGAGETSNERPGGNENANYIESRALLDKIRTVFRLHSKSLDIVKFALLRIDAVFWMGWDRVLGLP
ncbi:hypothetical protein BDV59DRAFT_176134 [Aspergillus ambiguus]|uniref:fungal specific transcription factor domain-containing protein n=1 Tax=Aspergillus ambiguus TaxID=176160 RepID=UPI003CCDCD70